MTNPYPSGRPYSNSPPTNPANFRRTSYASVAAGIASANHHSHPQSPPARSGALSHLLRNEELDRMRERESASYNSQSSFGTFPTMAGTDRTVERPWVSAGHLDGLGDDLLAPTPDFICPSYLRNSRHVERLHTEHLTAVATAKESHRQGKHVYYNRENPPSASMSTSSSGVNLPKLSSPFGRPPAHDVIDPVAYPESGLSKLPSCWSDIDKCPGLDISNDGLDVKFQGQTKTSDEAAAIRSDHPMPREVGLFYFEVTIISRGKEG